MTSAPAKPLPDTTASLRWAGYALLIAVSAGNMLGHVLSVTSPDRSHHTPFLSANDRSRWANVRALTENGTYAIDEVITDKGWDSIDKVWHPGPDGKFHYYSSKPPLLATIVAGEYWVLYNVTAILMPNPDEPDRPGMTLSDHPYFVARALLIVTNVIPLVLAFVLLTLLIEEHGETDLGRVFAVAALTAGTFLTTFAATLNNHVPAAVCVAIFLYTGLRAWSGQCTNPLRFAAMGFFGALLVAFELPALAFFALATAAFLWRYPRETLLVYLPSAALIAAAALGTNWLAHGTLLPAYSQRGDGAELFMLPSSLQGELDRGEIPSELVVALESAAHERITPDAKVHVREPGLRWEIRDEMVGKRFAIVRNRQEDEPWMTPRAGLRVHRWANWYDFPGGYWSPDSNKKSDIDKGEPSMLVYAFQCLIGHHGVFSLSPIWIAAFAGLPLLILFRGSPLRDAALATIAVTLVTMGFYFFVVREIDRNYGGMTVGLRWFFWLYPLWLLGLIPAADWLSRHSWRWSAALLLLVVSALSASFGASQPWQQPWIAQWLEVYWPAP